MMLPPYLRDLLRMIPKEISSLQHPLVKHWVRLRTSSSYRRRENALLATGENIFPELAVSHTFRRILVQKGSSTPPSLPCEEYIIVTEEILKKITGLSQPEPIVAEMPLPRPADLVSAERLLIIDRIADPGNLGTLLRSALAFGWDGVFFLEGSVDPFNDKAFRASKGALFRLPFSEGDEEDLEQLIAKKKWVVLGASMEGRPIESTPSYTPPFMLILGSEASGLSSFSKKRAELLSLPMKGEMESLNVAVAGGILMYLLRA